VAVTVSEPGGDVRKDPRPESAGRSKGLVEGSMWGAGVLLVAALVVLLNYFGMKYHQRFDWTGSKIYSLSEKSKSMLEGLDRDVTVTVFLQPGGELYDPTRELLERYAAGSPRVTVRYVDPQKNLIEAQRLVDQFQLSDLDVVIFEAGGDRRVVDASSLADWDYSGMQFGAQPTLTGFRGEEEFTGAILELVEGRKSKVLFSTGHGERALADTGAAGLSRIGDLLGKENLELDSWASTGRAEVPAGTDLLVIAGPRTALLAPELEALDRYLDAGGRLLVLLDPELDDRGGLVETGLEAWLARRGVEVGRNLVVDPSATIPFFGAETISVGATGAHPIVESLAQAQLSVIVGLARSAQSGAPPAGHEARELLETTADGWGETGLADLRGIAEGADDAPGPVAVAVAVAPKQSGAEPELEAEELEAPDGAAAAPAPTAGAAAAPAWRMVVVGDSDFATNGQLANAGNPTFVANAFNWLLERHKLLGIGAKKPEQARLALTPGQLSGIGWLSLAGLPALAIAAGVAVWFRRRR
jgi:ABC-type uncharacterized transport system involved in gliding motility auxiliary subunit